MSNRNRLKEKEKESQMTQTASQAQVRFTTNEVPTIEQCQQNVRERAYQLWETAGYPEGDGVDFFLQAEQELYGSPVQNGYRIYVGKEKSDPTPKILTFNGDLEDERAETENEAPATPANTRKETVTA